MKNLKIRLGLFSLLAMLAVSVFLTSCEQEPTLTLTEQMQKYDLGVQEYTEKKIQGQTVIIGHTLSYEAIEKDRHYEVTIQLNDKKFEAEIGYSPNYYVINGGGVKLNKEESYVLSDFAGSFADAVSNRSGNSTDVISFYLVERTLVTVISLLGEAPQNYAIENKTYTHEITTTSEERSLGNDGIKCIKIGSRYTLSFDRAENGYAYTLNRKVESQYTCRGRCGPGCNVLVNGWKWTMDCLEHDWCVYYIGDSVLGDDENCGDEFWNAADDFLFADLCYGDND